MRYIIFGRSIVFVFYINLIEPDYVQKKITLYTTAVSTVENFDTTEQLTTRLVELGELLKVDAADLANLEPNETEQA